MTIRTNMNYSNFSHESLVLNCKEKDFELEKLYKESKDASSLITNLQLRIDNLKEQQKVFAECTSSIYTPNKNTYNELEKKLEEFEANKRIEIDKLQNIIKQKEENLNIIFSKVDYTRDTIKNLEKTIKEQDTVINFAVGYISATQNSTNDKTSPKDIKTWLSSGGLPTLKKFDA